ncbi:MAG TPA: NAD(P)-dependent alcohol dehydrogenase [Burkholderiaceae bacterium]|nr:NAD(P)-dependent alcohol dehydrogenase [Burkholderiaceae bacterium]
MKVFQVQHQWSHDHLAVADRPEPLAGPGQVRLAMRATALNYRDLLVPDKGYGSRMQALPLVMLSDGVGVVDQVGTGVVGVTPGDRLCPMLFQGWQGGAPDAHKLSRGLGCETDGTMAQYLVTDPLSAAPVPAYLSDEEAASLPTAGVTAWRALVTDGNVRPGDVVLVQGTGGVALFALQFAKLLGAHVIALTSTAAKAQRLRELGADEVLNYRDTPEWGRPVKALATAWTGRDGVDHVVELGGGDTLPQSLRAVRAGGTVSLIGVLGGNRVDLPLGLVVTRAVRLQGVTVGGRDDFMAMCIAMSKAKMRPVVDSVWPFEQLREAMAHLKNGAHVGKVCLRVA